VSKKLVVIAAASIVASSAMAQVSNFTGLSGALNINLINASSKIQDDEDTLGLGESSTSVGGQIAVGQAISPSAVVSIGASLNAGTIKSGFINDSNIRAKNMYSFYIEPGMLVSNSTLAYGKLAYSSFKGTVRYSDGSTDSETFNGFGLGGGIRTMLNDRSYLQVEVMQTNFGKEGGPSFNVKPTVTMGSIGYGFKF
jgi:opacity protein-like surface antigen